MNKFPAFFTFEELMQGPINYVVCPYIMASYLYYVEGRDSPLTDNQFDALCKRLLDEWDTCTHKLKFLTDPELLRAGTGYSIPREAYPGGVIRLAHQWADWGDERRTQ